MEDDDGGIRLRRRSGDLSDGSGVADGGGGGGVRFAVPPAADGRQVRLRRVRSTSRAEEIVTEAEKQRRAQPDKP
jgi:hypothetical protein